MTTEPTHKVCPICEDDLPIDNFPIRGNNKKGHHTYCKPCTSTFQKLHELWKKHVNYVWILPKIDKNDVSKLPKN